MLALIERTVAMRTECHAASYVFRFALHIQFAPACPCGNDYRRCMEHLAAYGGDTFFRSLQLYFLYLTLLENLYRIVLYMCAECVGKFCTSSLRHGDKVFYAYRLLYLSAYALGNNRHP